MSRERFTRIWRLWHVKQLLRRSRLAMDAGHLNNAQAWLIEADALLLSIRPAD